MKHITFKIPATSLLVLFLLGACSSEECSYYEKTKGESSPVTGSTDNPNIKKLQRDITACVGQSVLTLTMTPSGGNIAACVKKHLKDFARKHDCD